MASFSFVRCARTGTFSVEGEPSLRVSFEHQRRPLQNPNALVCAVWSAPYFDEAGTRYFEDFTAVTMPVDALAAAFQGSKLGDALAMSAKQALRFFGEHGGEKSDVLKHYESINWFTKTDYAGLVAPLFDKFGAAMFNWPERLFKWCTTATEFEMACAVYPSGALTPSSLFLADPAEREAAQFLQGVLAGRAVCLDEFNDRRYWPRLRPFVTEFPDDNCAMTDDDCARARAFIAALPDDATRAVGYNAQASSLDQFLRSVAQKSTAVVVVHTMNFYRARAVAQVQGFTCLDRLGRHLHPITLPVAVLRPAVVSCKLGMGPLWATAADYDDLTWPAFAPVAEIHDGTSKFFLHVTTHRTAAETLREMVNLNLVPVRRGSYTCVGFYEHLRLGTPRYVQGTHVKINATGEIAVIAKVLKKPNSERRGVRLDNDIVYAEEDVTLISQVSPVSTFRKVGRGHRYGTVVAFVPFTTSVSLARDKVSHDDLCRVMELVYLGMASKLVVVAQSHDILREVCAPTADKFMADYPTPPNFFDRLAIIS